MKLKIGSYVILNDGAAFIVRANPDDDDTTYPFEGLCISNSTKYQMMWIKKDLTTWTLSGKFNASGGENHYDVKIQYNKEENPEYFL